MSCVNITPEGKTAIGFTDLSDKTPVNYYLLVGTTGGVWSVLAADYDEEWAQLKKDDITITLKLGKGLIDAPPTVEATHTQSPESATIANTAGTLQRLGIIRRPSENGGPPLPRGPSTIQRAEMMQRAEDIKKLRAEGGDVRSYLERLRERKAVEKEAAEEEARKQLQDVARKVTEEEMKKKEREVNLRLIEQGAHPISDIELTQEEEAALVEKGILAQ
jgi:hypothetical protein